MCTLYPREHNRYICLDTPTLFLWPYPKSSKIFWICLDTPQLFLREYLKFGTLRAPWAVDYAQKWELDIQKCLTLFETHGYCQSNRWVVFERIDFFCVLSGPAHCLDIFFVVCSMFLVENKIRSGQNSRGRAVGTVWIRYGPKLATGFRETSKKLWGGTFFPCTWWLRMRTEDAVYTLVDE